MFFFVFLLFFDKKVNFIQKIK